MFNQFHEYAFHNIGNYIQNHENAYSHKYNQKQKSKDMEIQNVPEINN